MILEPDQKIPIRSHGQTMYWFIHSKNRKSLPVTLQDFNSAIRTHGKSIVASHRQCREIREGGLDQVGSGAYQQIRIRLLEGIQVIATLGGSAF